MLDREEKPRNKPPRPDKSEEERNEQLKAAVKPKEVVKSIDQAIGIMCVHVYVCIVHFEYINFSQHNVVP